MTEFLEKFMKERGRDRRALSKNTIHHDKFDREEYEHLLKEMREFSAAEDRLTDVVDTGGHAYEDSFFSLMKSVPELEDPRTVQPSHQINHVVMDEAMQLKEHEELRLYSVGDPVGAGLAAISMEPELETLFDKVQQEQKLADQLQQQMDEYHDLEDDLEDIDEMMEGLDGEGEGRAEGQGKGKGKKGQQPQPQDYQQQKDKIEQAMKKLEQQMNSTRQELEQKLDEKRPEIRASMQRAMKEALDEAADMDMASQTWGLEPGQLQRMPADKRIELARRMSNDRFRRIAQLFGPMQRMAFAEQMRKTEYAHEEIYDIETGNDLSRMLATELLKLTDPILKLEFLRAFYEGGLLQYKLRGREKLAKGGIIWCEDGSGSMSGDPEIWAKAVGLCLLQIAKAQNRPFYGIHFGSPGQHVDFDFTKPRDTTFEQVIEFAETFYGGGTCFMTPLSVALGKIKEDHARDGSVKADIVFATDGHCGVSDEWMEEFKSEQERLAFRVYGIVIGGHPETEPLNTICDGRVLTVHELRNGNDLREIFRRL